MKMSLYWIKTGKPTAISFCVKGGKMVDVLSSIQQACLMITRTWLYLIFLEQSSKYPLILLVMLIIINVSKGFPVVSN